MRKITSDKGFSRVEVFSLTGITIMVLFLIFMAIRWHRVEQWKGEDKLLFNTAESVAQIQTIGSHCPVRGCNGGEGCTHRKADGSYVGYFDHPTNTIQGERGAGYNQYTTVWDDTDREYHGARNTLVIQVTEKDGTLTYTWVKGR